jgi:hypothetical protein
MKNSTRKAQENLYRELFINHKGTPMATSSESWEHKKLRFSQLAEIFLQEDKIEVHDVGMGTGSFYEFLIDYFPGRKISYSGTEILNEYVIECQKNFLDSSFYCRDLAEKKGDDMYDYLILSGIFHQRRNSTIKEWESFSQSILKNSFEMAVKGIAFNFISPFVDFYQTEVYYCNLPKLLNFINDELSRFFTIRHNYALFEFTVFVYKEKHIKSIYPQTEFQKYFKA